MNITGVTESLVNNVFLELRQPLLSKMSILSVQRSLYDNYDNNVEKVEHVRHTCCSKNVVPNTV